MSLNVIDSSAWLEYFGTTPQGNHFQDAIEDRENLIVPVITIYEVFKTLLRQRGQAKALEYATLMRKGKVINLTTTLALNAAKHSLPLADSIIYATAISHNATLWTQDTHFEGLPNVRYFRKLDGNAE